MGVIRGYRSWPGWLGLWRWLVKERLELRLYIYAWFHNLWLDRKHTSIELRWNSLPNQCDQFMSLLITSKKTAAVLSDRGRCV